MWKTAPFLRLVIFLASGILIQWELKLSLNLCYALLLAGALQLMLFFFLPNKIRFKLLYLSVLPVLLIFVSFGTILCYNKDIRNNKNWYGNIKNIPDYNIVTIKDAPIEKPKSFKAIAILSDCRSIIYFQKDSQFRVTAGTMLVFKKPLQEIKNFDSLPDFNYKRYCLFNGITHQVYLKQNEYYLLEQQDISKINQLLLNSRNSIVTTLKKNIPGKQEAGLAEALLVGYKNDLDRSLVQTYSNTGVVHIIAISGLHLGLIYWILLLLLKPLNRINKLNWLRPMIVIFVLWTFSLLAGAQPSVLRAALMFSVLLLGELAGRKSPMFNSLALSAFILLCINPFWLWDIGFQLSYAAVLSIIIFMRPVYNLFYIKNKWLDMIWKMNSVTISAQILTTPLSIYHFHQFPNFFLLSNCIAVPLSTLILFAELILCLLYGIPILAGIFGKITSYLIRLMNLFVEWVDQLPGSLTSNIDINTSQTVFLYLIIAGLSAWLLYKIKKGVIISLTAVLAFLIIRAMP